MTDPKTPTPLTKTQRHLKCRAGNGECDCNVQELRYEADLSGDPNGMYRALHFTCTGCKQGWVLKF